jgi:hypothetical protein
MTSIKSAMKNLRLSIGLLPLSHRQVGQACERDSTDSTAADLTEQNEAREQTRISDPLEERVKPRNCENEHLHETVSETQSANTRSHQDGGVAGGTIGVQRISPAVGVRDRDIGLGLGDLLEFVPRHLTLRSSSQSGWPDRANWEEGEEPAVLKAGRFY